MPVLRKRASRADRTEPAAPAADPAPPSPPSYAAVAASPPPARAAAAALAQSTAADVGVAPKAQAPYCPTPYGWAAVPAAQPAMPPPFYPLRQEQLPPFWEGQVENWFITVEAAFVRMGIADSRHRFSLIMAALTTPMVQELEGIFHTALADPDPYQVLKADLINRYRLDTHTRMQRAFCGPELGGRAPDALWREMKALVPDQEGVYQSVMKFMFLRRLPVYLREALAHRLEHLPADDFVAEAQRRWRAHTLAKADRPAAPVAPVPGAGDDVEEVAAVRGGRRQQQSGGRTRPPGGGHSGPAGNLCWTHRRFGAKAYQCRDPANCPMAAQVVPRPAGNAAAGAN